MCQAGALQLVTEIGRIGPNAIKERWQKVPRGRTGFEKGGVEWSQVRCPAPACSLLVPVVRQFWIQDRLSLLGRAVHYGLTHGSAIAMGHVDVHRRIKQSASIARRSAEPLAPQWQGLFWTLFKTALLGIAEEKLAEPFRPIDRWNELPPPRDRDRVIETVRSQVSDAGEELRQLGGSDRIRNYLRAKVIDLSSLGYTLVRERTVQGFHCTADADIAFRNSSAKTSVVVEVKSGEDDRWPPVHQPVANFFHHNLVLHIRIQPRREQVQERLDAVRESSRKAMQLLEGTKRVCFIRV